MLKKFSSFMLFMVFLVSVFGLSGCQNNKQTSAIGKVDLFARIESQITYPIYGEINVSARINTNKPFYGFEILAQTQSAEPQHVTMTIYKFVTDIKTTLAEKDIVKSQKFDNVHNGNWLYLQSSELEPGEYLLLVSSTSENFFMDRQDIVPELVGKVAFGYSGSVISDGAFPFRLLYSSSEIEGLTIGSYLENIG